MKVIWCDVDFFITEIMKVDYVFTKKILHLMHSNEKETQSTDHIAYISYLEKKFFTQCVSLNNRQYTTTH